MKSSELTDEKIGSLIDHKVTEATSWFSSKLSNERRDVMRYLNREEPKPPKSGSTWVAPHVYNSVEYMRAQLGDTFSAGSGIVSFDALHPQDIEAARIASEYTNHVFYKQNPGERLIRDAIFDGLTARVGIAKVYWDKDEDLVPEDFDNATPMELDAAVKSDIITDLIVEGENYDGTSYGRLVRRLDRGQVRVEVIPPEEFAIARDATELSDKFFCVHRTMKTVQWIVQNYPEMKGREDELAAGSNDDLTLTPEVQARRNAIYDGVRLYNDPVQDELEEVAVYEAYCRFKRKGDLTDQLYRVLRCGKVNIVITPVEDLPFVVFTPIPRPHMFYGENFARTVMPTQDLVTAIDRSVVNHAMITNNPRWLVAKGSLINPRELLDNRLGGIVNVKDLNSVQPMQQPPMNPMLAAIKQNVEQTNEAVTGISAASIGLNKDVLSKQNSSALLEQQTGMSQIRQKEIARNFANHFLVPLFEKIYKLVVAFDKKSRQVEVAGNWVQIDPVTWAEGRVASASVHLGYGEREARAREIIEFASVLKERGGDMFTGTEGMYAMLTDAMTLKGHRVDIARYLPITPDKIQPAQPSPREMAEIEQLQADAYSKKTLADATMMKANGHAEIATMKQRLNEMQAMIGKMKVDREQHRKDIDILNKIDIAQREMELLENPPANAEEKAIISP